MTPMRKSSSAKKNLLLVLASLTFALLVAEVVVRIVDPVRPPDRVEFEVDREAYWRVRANQSDDRPPATNVNAQGFRGLSDVGEKLPERTRVFVLGDSYTWGSGVADEQTYSAQLEALSKGHLEVINGGTPGWGVFQFQVRLERRIDELDPDVVVVLVNTADILRQPYASKEEEEAFLRRSTLRNAIRRTSKLVTVTYRLFDRLRLQMQNRQVANAYAMDRTGGVRPEVFERLVISDVRRLMQMARLAEQHGAKFVLVAWPQQTPNTPSFLTAMQSFAISQDVSYIDLSTALAKYPIADYTLPNDHHPSELGHRIIAEQLYSVISDLGSNRP